MAKYRISFDVDLVGLEIPTKPDMPTPSVTPTYIPAPQPQRVPGYHQTWQGYAPVPQAHALPQATYSSWGGYAPVSPTQVGQQTPTPPEASYVTPPAMLPNETPALVPEKVDLHAEHYLALLQNHLDEIERLEQAGNAPENVLKEAKDKYQLELEKATVKAQVEELAKKVEKGEGEKGK